MRIENFDGWTFNTIDGNKKYLVVNGKEFLECSRIRNLNYQLWGKEHAELNPWWMFVY